MRRIHLMYVLTLSLVSASAILAGCGRRDPAPAPATTIAPTSTAVPNTHTNPGALPCSSGTTQFQCSDPNQINYYVGTFNQCNSCTCFQNALSRFYYYYYTVNPYYFGYNTWPTFGPGYAFWHSYPSSYNYNFSWRLGYRVGSNRYRYRYRYYWYGFDRQQPDLQPANSAADDNLRQEISSFGSAADVALTTDKRLSCGLCDVVESNDPTTGQSRPTFVVKAGVFGNGAFGGKAPARRIREK